MMEKKFLLTVLLIALLITSVARAASIVGSKHDLSSASYAPNEVCAYCHTPHFANMALGVPLWNKNSANIGAFTMYTSPTMNASVADRPSGVSLACLTCHDGAASKGASAVTSFDTHNLVNAPGSGLGANAYRGNCAKCHPNHGNYAANLPVGPDLTNDHPISMIYPTAAQDAAFFTPPDLQKGWSDMPLFGGKVECASCHNVHDPAKTPFLRIANTGSALCYKCHNK